MSSTGPVAATDLGRSETPTRVDLLVFPAIMLAAIAATAASIDRVHGHLLTPLVIGAVALLALGLERWRPERPDYQRRDESLGNELGHFLLGTEVGTAIGYGAALALASALAGPIRGALGGSLWPGDAPVVAQVALAMAISDLGSYGQHRLFHRVAALWPGHALHHRSPCLTVFKSGRFHALDYATGTFVIFAPLLLLGAPEAMLVWVSVLTGTLGVLQHANARLPTPAWLDGLICTPVVHWRHHSRARADDGNFACVFTLYDRLLGTHVDSRGQRPAALGLDEERPPRGLLAQLAHPLRPITRR